MEPIIYTLTTQNDTTNPNPLEIREPVVLDVTKFVFDSSPNPKLIKYGFNNINEKLPIESLTSIPQYAAGLNFNFDQDFSKDKTIKSLGIKMLDQAFAEIWELVVMWRLLDAEKSNSPFVIATNQPEIMQDIADVYAKTSKLKYKVEQLNKKANLVVVKNSDINIDENTVLSMLINQLPGLMKTQTKGSNMVLQIYAIQTQATVELINWLRSVYQEAYIARPSVESNLSDSKYLVLINLLDEISFPKIQTESYVSSFGTVIPEQVISTIQCCNADLIPLKYRMYTRIKEFLDTKVYEGSSYQELIQQQQANHQEWMDTRFDFQKMQELLDKVIQSTSKKCEDRIVKYV